MNQKVTSYSNIFECGRNILDQLDVTYQQALMATSRQDEYHKDMKKSLITANIGSDGKIFNEKIQQEVFDLRA